MSVAKKLQCAVQKLIELIKIGTYAQNGSSVTLSRSLRRFKNGFVDSCTETPDGLVIKTSEHEALCKLAELNALQKERVLKGIVWCRDGCITELHLDGLRLTDISSLSVLTALESLWLSNNRIKNIEALAGLHALRELFLSENEISDIGALSALVNLRALFLRRNQITEIESLKALVNLTVLDLQDNQIQSVKSLPGLINLDFLYLSNNPITDLDVLTESPAELPYAAAMRAA